MAAEDTSIAHIAGDEDLIVEALPRRTHTVGTRLSQEEVRQLAAIADARQLKIGDILRELILDEIGRKAKPPSPDPMLAEIVGVRLLLVNLFRPGSGRETMTPENFEALLAEIKRVKKQLAIDIQRDDWKR